MPVATIEMKSKALERHVFYTALLPDPAQAGEGPYPVLVQLHGYSDNHTAWLYKSNLWQYVEKLPLIVVLPDGANGWWANLGRSQCFEDFVVQDLREHVSRTLPAEPARPWAIGGLSMGGFGALRLGLKHPDKFCSIFAHSSAIRSQDDDFVWSDDRWSEDFRIRLRADLDCYRWARELDPTTMPRLSFDCGVDDHLLDDNRRFHAFLLEIDIPHEYNEYPGGHIWPYWDEHVREALRQHCEVLGITKASPSRP